MNFTFSDQKAETNHNGFQLLIKILQRIVKHDEKMF